MSQSCLRSGRVAGRRRTLLAALVALPGLVAPVGAAAAPVSLELQYTCTFPLMDPQPLSLKISTDIPTTYPSGKDLEPIAVTASADVGEFAAHGLRALESKTIEGTAIASASVLVPGGAAVPAKVNTVIPKLSIPATGGFTTGATGKTPSLNFDAAGPTKLRVNDLVLSLEPRLADGTLTGLDKFETECAQVPGQDNILATINVTDDTEDTQPPSTPAGLTATSTQTSAALTWAPSTDNVAVAGYDVFQNGTKVATVTQPTATINNLVANTSYAFTVQAFDAAGNRSAVSAALNVKTGGPVQNLLAYDLAGTASIKTLTKGTFNVNGSLNATLAPTGTFSGDLLLNQASARLTSLGFLPVTAKVVFSPSGKTTGSLSGGILNTSSLVRIKVPEVKLFGAIPLAGGNGCQSKSLSTINLKSGAGFDPAVGGTISGVFSISDLNGCGVLNGLVSPLTAGGGNALSLKLTPKTTA